MDGWRRIGRCRWVLVLLLTAAVSVGAGEASGMALHKSTLFITTTGGGLSGLDVDLGENRVKLGSWKEVF